VSALGPLEAETCRDYVVPRLRDAGWSEDRIVEQYPVTDGRIAVVRGKHRRGERLRADYLLEVEPGFAVAVVEAKREHRLPSDGLQQAMRYAELLDLPLAYSTNGTGIVEHDFDTGLQTALDRFPSPDEAWRRYRAWKGIAGEDAAAAVLRPFARQLRNPDGTVKAPRYYQRVAIERALEAILGGRKRVLLTLATGTGKTFVSLQIVWKLSAGRWPAGSRNPRILYLADRNILVDQPIEREFRRVFEDAIWKIRGEAKTGREVYFALYQALADTGEGLGLFRDYPADYFDLVIVDECHRGSARDDSTWRAILEHFAPAAQLGMTATPLREDNRDTYAYFGNPVYEYSLAQGIEDGFLAPYRVRRVVLSPDAYGWRPDQGQLDLFGREIPPGLYETRHFERVVSLLARTELAARHLTGYLKRTGRMAKTIVFCVDSDHAEQMRAALHRENADLTRQHPHYVARIVSDEGDVGTEHLGNFADVESETPVIATTSKLLSTGVDLPTVENIVLFKPIGSIVEFKQIIGRGTRLYPDADKLSFEIIDYSGATALFEDPAFDGPPETVVEEEIGAGGEVSGSLSGIFLGLSTGATWAAYSVIIAPLMRTYSPLRISAVVVPAAWVGIAMSGISQTEDQDWSVGWEVWALLLFATLGPLVVTNVLWFRSIHRIGPNRATLAVNLQPFVAAVLAVVLLNEPLALLQVVGGVLIAVGILIVRRRAPAPQAA